jgi:RNA polymerase sigma-70 factor (ECF subfamily)
VDDRSDRQLLESHLQGDPQSFTRLVERYARDLYGFLYRFTGNAAVADDIVQETFLQVHVSVETFDLSRRFKPWLYTIAANKARDHLRTRGRRQERSLDVPSSNDERRSLADSLEAELPPLGEEHDAEELRERVRDLISQMPEHLRIILLLGYFDRLSYAEIAEVLGIPVGTVKSRLYSAVRYFGRLWEQANDTTPTND